jgi:hypothetical protein
MYMMNVQVLKFEHLEEDIDVDEAVEEYLCLCSCQPVLTQDT